LNAIKKGGEKRENGNGENGRGEDRKKALLDNFLKILEEIK
jgi:hypothetical protein